VMPGEDVDASRQHLPHIIVLVDLKYARHPYEPPKLVGTKLSIVFLVEVECEK
jgi:hypothetical protein